MKSRSVNQSKRPRRFVECFAAACSGTARLTDQVGHLVVHVGMSNDASRSIADLNAREHGSGTLWPGSFQPLEPQKGWDDWAMLPLEPSSDGGLQAPLGAAFSDGLIRLAQPQGITIAELREQLSGALRRLRFQDVVRQPRWLETRSEADPFAEIIVHPRYAFSGRDFRGATLVTDLFVLDPSQESTRLLWMVVGACLAAGDGRVSRRI